MRNFDTAQVRLRFFNESGNMLPPFVNDGWRGCVLDRDEFNNTRMPQVLFEALVGAAGTAEVMIWGYVKQGETCVVIPASWVAYTEHMLQPSNYSPEYVICDKSQSWAILADVDVTTIGADGHLATAVDQLLSNSGHSLLALTEWGFEGINLGAVAYFKAVAGAI